MSLVSTDKGNGVLVCRSLRSSAELVELRVSRQLLERTLKTRLFVLRSEAVKAAHRLLIVGPFRNKRKDR